MKVYDVQTPITTSEVKVLEIESSKVRKTLPKDTKMKVSEAQIPFASSEVTVFGIEPSIERKTPLKEMKMEVCKVQTPITTTEVIEPSKVRKTPPKDTKIKISEASIPIATSEVKVFEIKPSIEQKTPPKETKMEVCEVQIPITTTEVNVFEVEPSKVRKTPPKNTNMKVSEVSIPIATSEVTVFGIESLIEQKTPPNETKMEVCKVQTPFTTTGVKVFEVEPSKVCKTRSKDTNMKVSEAEIPTATTEINDFEVKPSIERKTLPKETKIEVSEVKIPIATTVVKVFEVDPSIVQKSPTKETKLEVFDIQTPITTTEANVFKVEPSKVRKTPPKETKIEVSEVQIPISTTKVKVFKVEPSKVRKSPPKETKLEVSEAHIPITTSEVKVLKVEPSIVRKTLPRETKVDVSDVQTPITTSEVKIFEKITAKKQATPPKEIVEVKTKVEEEIKPHKAQAENVPKSEVRLENFEVQMRPEVPKRGKKTKKPESPRDAPIENVEIAVEQPENKIIEALCILGKEIQTDKENSAENVEEITAKIYSPKEEQVKETVKILPKHKLKTSETSVKSAVETQPAPRVEIHVSVEERPIDSKLVTPKVSMGMKVEQDDILQKDINVVLPVTETKTTAQPSVFQQVTGQESKKEKKKHKHDTPKEEDDLSIGTSVAKSTEIIISEDSVQSDETPQPTDDIFASVSHSEEDDEIDKDTGYEADKTTVDESVADDPSHENRKRKKKKRKQKVKVTESDESHVPISVYDSSSVVTNDEEAIEKAPVKKERKRKKGRRDDKVEPQITFQAKSDEAESPHDSYHTISTDVEPTVVNIIEESVIERPKSESPKDIISKIVTTVPVIESVITQETDSQTSPPLSGIISVSEKAVQEPVSVQTSPELPKEISDISVQTVVEKVTKDDFSQVEIPTTETLTQTSPTIEEVNETIKTIMQTVTPNITPPNKIDTTEISIQTFEPVALPQVEQIDISMQTVTPEPVVSVEEEIQTVTPWASEIPKRETAMQTTIVKEQEEFPETPETQLPKVQTSESSIQAQPMVIGHSIQTSPEPLMKLSREKVYETVTQTSPSLVQTSDSFSAISSPEDFEIQIQTSMTIPHNDNKGKKDCFEIVEIIEKFESDSSLSDIDVQINVALNQDSEQVSRPKRRKHKKFKKPHSQERSSVEKDLMSCFKRQEDDAHLIQKDLYSNVTKRRSRTSSPCKTDDEREPILISKVVTSMTKGTIEKKEPKSRKAENVPFDVFQFQEGDFVPITTKLETDGKHIKPVRKASESPERLPSSAEFLAQDASGIPFDNQNDKESKGTDKSKQGALPKTDSKSKKDKSEFPKKKGKSKVKDEPKLEVSTDFIFTESFNQEVPIKGGKGKVKTDPELEIKTNIIYEVTPVQISGEPTLEVSTGVIINEPFEQEASVQKSKDISTDFIVAESWDRVSVKNKEKDDSKLEIIGQSSVIVSSEDQKDRSGKSSKAKKEIEESPLVKLAKDFIAPVENKKLKVEEPSQKESLVKISKEPVEPKIEKVNVQDEPEVLTSFVAESSTFVKPSKDKLVKEKQDLPSFILQEANVKPDHKIEKVKETPSKDKHIAPKPTRLMVQKPEVSKELIEELSGFLSSPTQKPKFKQSPLLKPEITPEFIVEEPQLSPFQTTPKKTHVSSVTIEEIESIPSESDNLLQSNSKIIPSKPESIVKQPLSIQDINIRWNHAQALERIKNLQNAKKTTHLSNVLYLATLHEVVTDESLEQKNNNVDEHLMILKEAIANQDIDTVQQQIITAVETITTWLETIEYRIYLNRQQIADGPSKERVQDFGNLKEEINNIEDKIDELNNVIKGTSEIYNEKDYECIKNYIESLQRQVKVIEDVTNENEELAVTDLQRWDEFIDGNLNVNNAIIKVKDKLSDLSDSDASPQTKLLELDKLENANKNNLVKVNNLLTLSKGLMRDFPGREIPKELYSNLDLTKQIEQQIANEREKQLQFLSLADEYEQTLKEFSQIIDIAEVLVESPINVRNLEHLENEMQNHRKFFVNLSHCRAILESLEENLDSETRDHHSVLHKNLYDRAKVILDKSTGRFQQMSLAASKWTVLQQDMKEEMSWLQVAQQRLPELTNVTSSDYDRFIDLYQSLALDIAFHYAKIRHFNKVAEKLQELVFCSGLEQAYIESLDTISVLQDDVQNNLKRLLQFRETWTTYNILSDKVEHWLKDAEVKLKQIDIPTNPRKHLRDFWELKAQHEVHNCAKQNATNHLEKSLEIIPIADEVIQRNFHLELQDQWQKVSNKINDIKLSIVETISTPNVPINEKLSLLEQELDDLKIDLNNLQGIIKNEEELNVYIERLQIMSTRLETAQNELGRLGLLSSDESDKVGALLDLSKKLELLLNEELEGANLLKDRLQTIQKGIKRVKRKHDDFNSILDQCENAQSLGSESVEKAVNECYEIGEELVVLWQDLMDLRQLLHTLPTRLRVTVSPIQIERDISQLQDNHTNLEKKCGNLLSLLRARLALWNRFEKQLELVQQSVKEADFMVELLTVQGTVDYERLRKATERLESLSGELVSRECLVSELKTAAQPLANSCTPEISQRIGNVVEEAVEAYTTTCTNLKELCTKYQNATKLWKQYRKASDLVREWVNNNQMESIADLEPDEAIQAVQICEKTLDAHTKRLAELRQLVSEIAQAIGLDANALLDGEVEALGKRLEDVRESLTILADIAETKAKLKEETTEELNKTKYYLDSVQKNIDDFGDSSEDKLVMLRNHLLALSKAEGQIKEIEEKSVELSPKQELSVIEILELWQQVFRETFQQYHRLSARLIKNEDGTAALKLWQEYLLSVQQFLQDSIPKDYHSLTEHQRLCQIHQDLLATQQSVLQPIDERSSLASGLVECSVMEKFNTLTNLHNETLAKIIDRHNEVRTRLNAWEVYKQDQNKLLFWLKNIEKERERIQLRFIHTRRLPNIIQRLENLVSLMPQGEEQVEDLGKQQKLLLQFCDDALATSIHMEHAAIKQRVSNLQAGLTTWKKFLERITNLLKTYEDSSRKIKEEFDNIQEIINESVQLPNSHSDINSRLDNLKRNRSTLNDMTKDLEELGLTKEQLKECLSPPDMKTINQKIWLLWHQQNDLDHQLATVCHQLEDKLSSKTMFDKKQARFIKWADELERKLNDDTQDPQEFLKKLETELQAEMALKEKEYNWLVTTGQDLVKNCGNDYSDITAKQTIQAKTDMVLVRWDRLENLSKNKRNKIQTMQQTIFNLEQRIAEIRIWLTQTEQQLTKPLAFESYNKNVIDKKLQEHDKLKKSIENESGNIGEVLNLCEFLLGDEDVWKANFSIDNIKSAIENVEKRWKIVCGLSAERKRQLNFIWKLLQELQRFENEQEVWLNSKEEKLKELDKPIKKLNKEEIQNLIYSLENEIEEIEIQTPIFEIFEQTYAKLMTTGNLDLKNVQDLTSKARVLLTRWHNLLPKARSLLQKLQNDILVFNEFCLLHENAVVNLTKIDADLTELQHLTSSSTGATLKKLKDLEKTLMKQNPVLENADKLGLEIMKRSKKNDIPNVQKMIDEYQLLWRDIQDRIKRLESEMCKEIDRKPQEIDESVQVETLKFEQDEAVQVNTLPPKLQRMTSISAKDAYLMELSSAIIECRTNIDDLQEIVEHQEISQASSELAKFAKRIGKLSATCQSNIELIKHLNDTLIKDCKAEDDEAFSEDVLDLVERFENLQIVAKEKQQKIRETSETGRLLCPLCTKRNWTQLDNDLWRLEKWLQVAESIQKGQNTPPTNIERLEDVIQDHREFLLDLDSHRTIVRSLNIVASHLFDHSEENAKTTELEERLEADNKRWDEVSRHAASWETLLQTALMDNQQFHETVSEMCCWLEKIEEKIRDTEPVDLTTRPERMHVQFDGFRDLKGELERCEPRIVSLEETTNSLLRSDEAPEGCSVICRRLTDLRLRLQSLIRLTEIYLLKLSAVLGRHPNETRINQNFTATNEQNLSDDLLDHPISQDQPSATAHRKSSHKSDGQATVLGRSCSFVRRVMRASLPIQALLLLLLGAATLVPYTEDDYACSLVNSIANSLTPTLRYNDGPPPV